MKEKAIYTHLQDQLPNIASSTVSLHLFLKKRVPIHTNIEKGRPLWIKKHIDSAEADMVYISLLIGASFTSLFFRAIPTSFWFTFTLLATFTSTLIASFTFSTITISTRIAAIILFMFFSCFFW